MNNHVIYLKQASPATKRILGFMRDMPYSANITVVEQMVNSKCKPLGYKAQFKKTYSYTGR